jgi:IMP cyclohydrolase
MRGGDDLQEGIGSRGNGRPTGEAPQIDRETEKLENRAGLSFDDAFDHQLASGISNCDGDRFHMNIHTDILHAIHI